MIGVYIQTTTARDTVEAIQRAEGAGVPAVWLTLGGTAHDSQTIFAAASMVTERIKFGTSIVPTWPRHPVVLAQQALALSSLAPGRFRLGIGPSHQAAMESVIGVEWRTPLRNLREYLQVLGDLLHKGSVDFAGSHVKTKATIPEPVDVAVMASALRPSSFSTCGELADGAISWVCPWSYLESQALPALRTGALKAGRTPPPLVAHVPVVQSEDRELVRQVAQEQIGRYGRIPFYQAMFAEAGYGDVSEGLTPELIDGLVVSGSAETISERLRVLLDRGAGEVIVHPLFAGDDRRAEQERAFAIVAAANAG